jgi:hypothetical protein
MLAIKILREMFMTSRLSFFRTSCLAFATLVLATGCSSTPVAPGDIRRIITVAGDADAAIVLADGPSSNVIELNGSRIIRLWETDRLPVSLNVAADAGATAGNAYREGFTGSSFYIAEIPPGSDLGDIPLHKQESLDYIAVMSGEIALVLPDRELRMRSGDILVQVGNMHSWINDTSDWCRLLVVVLTGAR